MSAPPLPSRFLRPGRAFGLASKVFALAALLLVAAGCSGAGPMHWVELKGQRFHVDVADEFDERARGLMFRERLGADAGMLFVHEREQPLAYWMKNTKIPLDILYFDADRRFVSMHAGVPPCSAGSACPSYPSRGPAKYVLELNAGRAAGLRLTPGDVLEFGPGIAMTGEP